MCEQFRSSALLPIDLLTRVLPIVLCSIGAAGMVLGGAIGLYLIGLHCAKKKQNAKVHEAHEGLPIVAPAVDRGETDRGVGATDAV